jgi:hypothetical protein
MRKENKPQTPWQELFAQAPIRLPFLEIKLLFACLFLKIDTGKELNQPKFFSAQNSHTGTSTRLKENA